MMNVVKQFVVALACLLVVVGCAATSNAQDTTADDQRPLTVVVMDPLSLPLSCACVKGTGQRLYEPLVDYLQASTDYKINLVYEESLQLAKRRGLTRIDVVIGKRSVVLADAAQTNLSFRAAANLTDRNGSTDLAGVVLVAKSSPIKKLTDLAGKRVAIGSAEHAECHKLAKDLFRSAEIDADLKDCGSIESAVYAFADQEADAVVVSRYLPPLLEACGKLEKGTTRTIAQTASCEGVQLFFATELSGAVREKLVTAIENANQNELIKQALESRDGFVLLADDSPKAEPNSGWTDWRGPDRNGQFPGLPKTLGETTDVLWRAEVTGPAMAGISATEEFVIVADKSADFKQDVFRAFDARTGEPVWTLKHDAGDRMEYTNAPRATPVIVGKRVLLQNAFGRLMCVNLATGQELWGRHLVHDFGGKVPTWGYSVPPLVVGDRVVIAPGSASASVAALDLRSGDTIWETAGHAPAYAPMIYGSFGGRNQVVGYDSGGLGGWDLKTGRRLWELIPPDNSDFHVGTPVKFRDGILLATENNGMRFYRFSADGRIDSAPVAENLDCAPDTCTPVVVSDQEQDRIFCTAYGEMFCVDGSDALKTVWSKTDDRFYDHTCLIAGTQRLLLWGSECDLLLFDTTGNEMKIVSQLRPMKGDHPESMSHPAIVCDRLYLRSRTELVCIRLPLHQP